MLPLNLGAQRAPATRGRRVVELGASRQLAVAVAVLLAFGGGIVGPRSAQGLTTSQKPRAVVIVGPASSSTSSFLDSGDMIADQIAAAGMDVTRIFHPHATWERVLNKINGANLVVYIGHGNGWPSPYAPFQERTKDGFGLDGYDGASRYSVTYYGGNPIRQNVRLAKNAVVALFRLCYSSGNGEPGMAIPSYSVAKERVDNYAAAFLDVGARTVFSFGWMQKWNLPKALMESDKTMDDMFETPYHGYPSGFIGWNDRYFDSERTSGARLHLDPHPRYGFYRAVTGDLRMTAGEWRNGGDGGGGGGGGDGDGGGTTAAPPELTSLSVVGTDDPAGALTTTTISSSSTLPTFHPNGDGLHDKVVMSHTLSTAAYLDVRVTNSADTVVRKFSVYAAKGPSTSAWGGRNNFGNYVKDGVYTLTYKPRDTYGNVGSPLSVKVLVLSAVALRLPQPAAVFSRDADDLAQATTVPITLNKSATVTVKVTGRTGTVRTLQAATTMAAGQYTFNWDGTDGAGNFVTAGTYQVMVTGQTSLGTYSEQRSVWVGAFRLVSSKAAPARGSSVTFTIYSTEPLSAPPKVDLSQPGLATYTVSTTKVAALKYKVTVTLKSGGSAGTLGIIVRGTDSGGQAQRYSTSLTLR